jgi:hypothetical protein
MTGCADFFLLQQAIDFLKLMSLETPSGAICRIASFSTRREMEISLF